MILAIERTKFTYLYKYNQIRIDINQLIDKPKNDLKGMLSNNLSGLIELFNSAIPLFEQDHEIILLEINKNKIILQNGILISFDSVQCIYPLTKTGSQLLDGKLNDDFILESPIFENAIEALRLKRSMDFRRSTSLKLLIHYDLESIIEKSMLSLIESAVEKNLLDKSTPQVFNSFLDNLIAYNKTPSYIPEGNIEHICKIGAIAIKYMGKTEEIFTNGHFYKLSLKYKKQINDTSYLTSYLDFNSISDTQLKSSIEKMVEIISKDYSGIDIFKVSFFFLAFKSFLNKHDNNIELLNNEIITLINNDKPSASCVIAMLGYTFSIESIYEGLHRISNAPLLKSSNSKKMAEIDSKSKRDFEVEKQKEQESLAIEKDKSILSEVNLPPESINKQAKDDVSVNSSEVPLEVDNGVIENISAPVVLHENVENEVVLEINKNSKVVLFESKSKIDSSKINDTALEREAPTVQSFKSYISASGQSKAKQNDWFKFLDYYFPSKHDELTLEILLDKLNALPELKDKLLNAKKDRESTKSFFDKYK